MIGRIIKTVALILFILLAIAFYWFYFVVDACLDGGGHWDDQNNQCLESTLRPKIDACYEAGGKWNYPEEKCDIE